MEGKEYVVMISVVLSGITSRPCGPRNTFFSWTLPWLNTGDLYVVFHSYKRF